MKKVKKLLILFLVAFMFTTTVSADDYAIANDNPNVKKDVNGNLFTAGNNVDVLSNIDGIGFIAGNVINYGGNSDYSFIAGNTVNITDGNFKDGFIAGNTINISTDITRDVYVAGNIINISGKIGRNAKVAGNEVNITGEINKNLYIEATKITISKNAKINGKLSYNDDAKIAIDESAKVNEQNEYKSNNKQSNNTSSVVDLILSYANLLAISLLILLIFNKVFINIEKIDFNGENIFKLIIKGFLILCFLPLACILLMISEIGLSTGLISLVLYICAIYLSNVFSTYYISNKFLKDKIDNKYIILIIGITSFYILKIIPIIGAICSIFLLFIGLGIICTLVLDLIKRVR